MPFAAPPAPTTPANPATTIWTIGHSTRALEDFLSLLHAHRIQTLVDVRHFPGSRRYPHFNREPLREALTSAGLQYEHVVELGGRRRPAPDSPNAAWRNASFRGYADYMLTPPFHQAIDHLLARARERRCAIMCSEAVWWRCHRSMIADHLKSIGVRVLHIMDAAHADEHPWTTAAHLLDNRLTYTGPPAIPARA